MFSFFFAKICFHFVHSDLVTITKGTDLSLAVTIHITYPLEKTMLEAAAKGKEPLPVKQKIK